MTKESAQRLAVAGMALQLATAIGVAASIAASLKTFGSLSEASNATAAAEKISEGLESIRRVLSVTRPLGLVGLVILAVGVGSGPLRQKWVYRWSCICMIPWILSIGIGTLVGLAGLVLLFAKRREFKSKDDEPNQPPQPMPLKPNGSP